MIVERKLQVEGQFGFSLRNLCVLCVSAVNLGQKQLTAETLGTPRLCGELKFDPVPKLHTALIMERVLVYLWALPATLLGLVFFPLAWISGGNIHLVHGVLEISGGLVSYFLRRGIFLIGGASAMTLGHVVLGQNQRCLEGSRQHERVHVAQYERWGPLMIPLYLLASGLARLRGEHPYWGNRFEREAHRRAQQTTELQKPDAALPPKLPERVA